MGAPLRSRVLDMDGAEVNAVSGYTSGVGNSRMKMGGREEACRPAPLQTESPAPVRLLLPVLVAPWYPF